MPDSPEILEDARILVVDDDPDVRESTHIAFEAQGADVDAVGDGNAAVNACEEHRYDLVVLDMMLPGRSGFLALEKIKGHDHSPAVIMVTANQGKRHEAYAQSLGVDAYLLKPVPLAHLLETAAKLIAARPQRVIDLEEAEDRADDDAPTA